MTARHAANRAPSASAPGRQPPGPVLTVDALMADPQLGVVLIRRGRPPFAGRWALPGGFVEDGEACEAASLPGRAQRAGDREGGFPGDVPDKLHVYVGGVYATFDTSFSYNPSESGVGLALNYEAFGLPESGIDPSLGGRWRISRRGSLYFGYNGSSREGNIALEEDVEFGDYTLLASTHLAIDFEGNIVHAGYRYDAYDNGEVRIAGSAGLSWVELKTGFQAEGAVLDPHGQLVTGVYAESYSVSAPAPQIGCAIDWAFSRRAEARVYLRTLYVDLGDVRGNFTSGGAEARRSAAGRRALGRKLPQRGKGPAGKMTRPRTPLCAHRQALAHPRSRLLCGRIHSRRRLHRRIRRGSDSCRRSLPAGAGHEPQRHIHLLDLQRVGD